jgi:hypothetical protein
MASVSNGDSPLQKSNGEAVQALIMFVARIFKKSQKQA